MSDVCSINGRPDDRVVNQDGQDVAVSPSGGGCLMGTVLRPGYYLEDNPPARRQCRVGRRDPIKPVLVAHTTESSPNWDVYDLAAFIAGRSDPGSYHICGDAQGNIIQLVDFANEAYGDRTGSNRWAIHIALVMKAEEWTTQGDRYRLAALVDTCAHMALIAADWLDQHGHGRPPPHLIDRAQSERPDASGFTSHALRDPGRRSDPGPDFPWSQMLSRYRDLTGGPAVPTRSISVPDEHMLAIQLAVESAGYDPGALDGIPGPRTQAAVEQALADLNEHDSDPGTADKARRYDELLAAERILYAHKSRAIEGT